MQRDNSGKEKRYIIKGDRIAARQRESVKIARQIDVTKRGHVILTPDHPHWVAILVHGTFRIKTSSIMRNGLWAGNGDRTGRADVHMCGRIVGDDGMNATECGMRNGTDTIIFIDALAYYQAGGVLRHSGDETKGAILTSGMLIGDSGKMGDCSQVSCACAR